MARPSTYSLELVTKICDEIATSSKGLSKICENPLYPSFSTLFKWLSHKDKGEFVQLYARARENQADFLADEIIEIADDKSGDVIETDNGPIENREFSSRSRLKIDARKWVASKLKPKKYGDKVDVTSDNKAINQLDLSHLTFEQLKELANDKGDDTTSS